MAARVKIGVLVSGSGSNLQSIIDQIEKGRLSADVRIVISNDPGAYALTRATEHAIPTAVVNHQDYENREDFDRKMVELLEAYGVELVVLAGFMMILTPIFLRAFPMRIMNIHPALLPSFPGLHAHRKVLSHGVKFSGCTVHFADDGVDTGPIIIQSAVPVYDDDTEETLAARVLREEHRIYPQAIQLFAEGRIEIDGRRVRVKSDNADQLPPLHNPPLEGF